jgi:hypothetical protein
MTSLSRPAQASLALRPAGLLNRPRRPLSRGSDTSGYPSMPLVSYQVLPTISWVDPSSTGESRRWGALRNPGWGLTPQDLIGTIANNLNGNMHAVVSQHLGDITACHGNKIERRIEFAYPANGKATFLPGVVGEDAHGAAHICDIRRKLVT